MTFIQISIEILYNVICFFQFWRETNDRCFFYLSMARMLLVLTLRQKLLLLLLQFIFGIWEYIFRNQCKSAIENVYGIKSFIIVRKSCIICAIFNALVILVFYA